MQLRGEVIHGDGYGKQLGFPTTNIDRSEFLKKGSVFKYGVYAGLVKLERTGEIFKAGIVIGPTDRMGLPKLEAHLIDYNGDLYGEKVTYYVLEFLRSYIEYDDESNLKDAIAEDIDAIRKMELCLPES